MDVLYATDGRAPALAAARLLSRLAVPGRVRVTATYVDDYGNQLVADRVASSAFEATMPMLSEAGLEVEWLRIKGHAFHVVHGIVDELRDNAYDLAVVGSTNDSWLARFILGGVSSALVHEAPIPVLMVREPPLSRPRLSVVVGTDGTPAAEQALTTLLEVTSPERADVFPVAVVDVRAPLAGALPMTLAASSEYLIDLIRSESEVAEHHLEGCNDRLEAAGFPRTGSVRRGAAATELIAALSERAADVAVIGARGLGRIGGLALGSVSTQVARHARASLIAPPASVERPVHPREAMPHSSAQEV